MGGSPFLALPGAVPAEGLDEGVPGHYGNPIVEQRRLERGEAIVDLSDRGILTVTGPDRLSWLHSMASQALDRIPPGGQLGVASGDGGIIDGDIRRDAPSDDHTSPGRELEALVPGSADEPECAHGGKIARCRRGLSP